MPGFVMRLYYDLNGNGILDTAEHTGGPLASVPTHDPTGSYAFGNLDPGDYIVCEETMAGYIMSYPQNDVCAPDAGYPGLEPSGYAFTLESDQDEVENNFFNTGELYGCTPGYFKNHTDRWVGYSYGDQVGTVFAAASLAVAGNTLLEALNFPGGSGVEGGERILLRAAVASLLNFAHPDVNFAVPDDPGINSTATLISAVNTALASNDRNVMLQLAGILDDANNAVNMCPLSGTRAFRPAM
jgi:hypothetical protein